MSKKRVWLLGFLMLALAFGGFSSAKADLQDVEITDYEGDTNGNDFGTVLSEAVVEGKAGDRDDLGTPVILKQEDAANPEVNGVGMSTPATFNGLFVPGPDTVDRACTL